MYFFVKHSQKKYQKVPFLHNGTKFSKMLHILCFVFKFNSFILLDLESDVEIFMDNFPFLTLGGSIGSNY